MSHKLKILSAMTLLSASSFAAEEGLGVFCPDQLDPHLDSYYQQGNRIEEAVFSHSPIFLTDDGIWGTLVRLGAPNELGIKKVIAVYDCSLHEDKTSATIRHYLDTETDPEPHDIEIHFLDNKIMEVYKLSGEDKIQITDSPLIGNPAPVIAHFPLSRLIGVPHDMQGELTSEGSVTTSFLSVFEQTQNIQLSLDAMKEQIQNQKTDLAEGIGEQLSNDFSQFQTNFDTKLETFETTVETLFTSAKTNVGENFSQLQDSIQKYAGEGATAALNQANRTIDSSKSFLKNEFQQTIQHLFEQLTGVTLGKNDLVRLLKSPIDNTTAFIRNLDGLNQVMEEYHALPGFYAGSIESMIHGITPDENTKNYEVWSIQTYINSSIDLLVRLLENKNLSENNSLSSYCASLQSMSKCFKETQDFIQNHDLQKEYRVLGYLKKMFGESIPVSSPSSNPLYEYCQSAHFSTKDYGIYGWIRDIYDTLKDYHERKEDDLDTYNANGFFKKIRNLFEGKVEEIVEEMKGPTCKQIFVIPETFFNGLQNYPQIVQAFIHVLTDANGRSFEQQLTKMGKKLTSCFEVFYQDVKQDMRTIHQSMKKWTDGNNHKIDSIHKELRYMIFRLTYLDIDDPKEKDEMTRALNLLDLKQEQLLTPDQRHELYHDLMDPHHRQCSSSYKPKPGAPRE